ncbi:MAG: SAM-dependent methyltransferase [Methanomicrobiales archaeon]|nr:SAM-dependent methyltransferase [Methanomicrobiales archaeon]
MKVRVIPKGMLKVVKGRLWVDQTRRTYVQGENAYVPVREGFSWETDLPDRVPYKGVRYMMLGNCAVIHGPRPEEGEIEDLIRWRRPGAVIWMRGVRGPMRLPDAEVIYGSSGEVCHREGGVSFRFDPMAVMFAQGNYTEKVRVATSVGPGERVADMFAGIGYFTIPVALHGGTVHAMEINPGAYQYLLTNISENGVASRVNPACGDCRDLLIGVYDRIIMGHFDAHSMLADALAHVRPGSILHLHACGASPPDVRPALQEAGVDAAISVITVKKCGPNAIHTVQDLVIR